MHRLEPASAEENLDVAFHAHADARATRELVVPQAGAPVVVPQAGAAVPAGAGADARLRVLEPRVGDVLAACYRIVGTLGRGGMGVVFEAENQRTGKRVAIKWMSGERAMELSGKAVTRFRREARAAAKIRHPNVIDIYDVGESEGTPFLVMERLQGESLRTCIGRGPLAWEQACELMLGVLRGMSAVHRAELVHRDLKPDNIFLCAADAHGPLTPKVLDFGVAAMRTRSQDGLSSLTRSGSVLGTPAYMALEQLTGGEVDERADVYALGVVLYEMLTQKLPFSARSDAERAVLQATSAPTPPSRYAPELHGARERVLLRALARNPDDRYPDVEAFAAALQHTRGPAQRRLTRLALLAFTSLAIAAGLPFLARRAAERNESRAHAAQTHAPLIVRTAPAEAASRPPKTIAAGAATADLARVHSRHAEAAPTAARRRRPDVMRPRDLEEAPRLDPGPPTAKSERQRLEIRLDDF